MKKEPEKTAPITVNNKDQFESAVSCLRSEIHAYCARMSGSVIDGEDILQTTLIKAFQSYERALPILNFRAWLYRIAHNCSIDMFREQQKQNLLIEEIMMNDKSEDNEEMPLLSDNLKQLMILPPLQRSVIIFRELFGYSANDIAELLLTTPAAIKSALSRARASLSNFDNEEANDQNVKQQPLSEHQHESLTLIKHYIELFNERKFDEIKSILRDEVKLDMVNKTTMNGKQEVCRYFDNYSQKDDWHLEPGFIEGKPAVLAFDPKSNDSIPKYFILLEFKSDTLRFIRDFRYADYVMKHAHWQRLG
ncbi:sigma-70 family RNA polymerase sigma factor [Pleionea sediminis]|uniref:sigma-70 family RNA polymerase sigma factor n=1 Tax=Pleionea sediminis TaxID=2569479 RepID=UPI0011865142|nr:sigma-70 family RNA polymerase sigma factor [Pleionea sediminis]